MSNCRKPVILTIDGHKYDVTNFEHPGEGIKDIYLADFNGKNCTAEFEAQHFTDDPFEMLLEARDTGECDGIKYLGKAKE